LNLTHPLELTHSWPLFERGLRFDLGRLHGEDGLASVTDSAVRLGGQALARCAIGSWECDLQDDALTWSDQVYDLFGLARDAQISRAETVAMYSEESRVAMERLRAHAIRHQRGFTLDAEINGVDGHRRWMRLTAAPICEGGRVVRLHGFKQDVSRDYM
jgi:PAS domain S-box-containing protein